MIAVRPTRFVHRGSVPASGFIIGAEAGGTAEARTRVLRLWDPGVQVKKLTDDVFIVLLPEPARMVAEGSPGEPLVRIDRRLIAFPVALKELNLTGAPADSVVFAKAGVVRWVSLADLPGQDVAEWIDARGFEVSQVISLGAPPQAPVFTLPTFEAREKIPGIPAASPELQNLLAQIRQTRPDAAGVPSGPPALSLSARLGRYFRGVWKRWKEGRQVAVARGQARASVSPAQKQGSSGLRRLFERLRLWLRLTATAEGSSRNPQPKVVRGESRLRKWLRRGGSQLLSFTRLTQWLSSRNGRYLARMMAMMESGDIEEGLRHAIPLSDATHLPGNLTWFPRLSVRRRSLQINPNHPAPVSSWAAGAQLYGHLRNLYRRAFERLKAAGRIEEAAFVLTELLSAHAEAVSFLEKHGRFRLAAEIAEGRKLAPALAIRLWWLAGERTRALTLAIRTEEFERAVSLLQDHPEEAARLRIAWAEWLAHSGKFLAAAETLWPLPSERHYVAELLDNAIELGGTSGAIALAKRSARFPESFGDMLPRVESLMEDESAEPEAARRKFAETLCAEAPTAESRSLARIAARALMRDTQLGLSLLAVAQFRNLLDFTGDACLRADAPPLLDMIESVRLPAGSLPASMVEIAASDLGAHVIFDLAWLADGRMLLAMGEAGLVFLTREGKIMARSSEPAETLVVSDDGNRAIGIARRGEVSRLTRIDVLARRAVYWCDATMTAHTPNFDGAVWCVANGEDLFMIDTLAPGFEALWRIPDMGGKVCVMRRSQKDKALYVLTQGKHLGFWKYELPGWVLRTMKMFDSELTLEALSEGTSDLVGLSGKMALSETGEVFFEVLTLSPAGGLKQSVLKQIRQSGARWEIQTIVGGAEGGNLYLSAARGNYLATSVLTEFGVDVYLIDTSSGRSELRVRLSKAKRVALRFAKDMLLCGDDQGRMLAIDILSGGRVRDFRV